MTGTGRLFVVQTAAGVKSAVASTKNPAGKTGQASVTFVSVAAMFSDCEKKVHASA